MSKLLRSPLFQFLLIGAVLAGAWAMIPGDLIGRGASADDEIRVDTGRLRLLEDRFSRAFQRPPSDEERAGLVRAHIREEALYRAARELQLDRDDPIVRRRLNQKMEFLLEPAPGEVVLDDADLQRYLDDNAERFLQPMQIALEQVHLRPEDTEPASIDAIRRALAEGDMDALPEPRGLLPSTLPLASIDNVERRFGRAFAERIAEVPVGEWTGPVESPFGLHFVRVDQRTPERLPPLDAIRDRVAAETRAARGRAIQEQRIDEVIARFEVIVDPDLDLEVDTGREPATGETGTADPQQ